jgi:hypothetical protein
MSTERVSQFLSTVSSDNDGELCDHELEAVAGGVLAEVIFFGHELATGKGDVFENKPGGNSSPPIPGLPPGHGPQGRFLP